MHIHKYTDAILSHDWQRSGAPSGARHSQTNAAGRPSGDTLKHFLERETLKQLLETT